MTTAPLSKSTCYAPPRSEPIPIQNSRAEQPKPNRIYSYKPTTHAQTKEIKNTHQAFKRCESHLSISAPQENLTLGRTPDYKFPEHRKNGTPSLLARMANANLPLTLELPTKEKST